MVLRLLLWIVTPASCWSGLRLLVSLLRRLLLVALHLRRLLLLTRWVTLTGGGRTTSWVLCLLLLPPTTEALEVLLSLQKCHVFLLNFSFIDLGTADEVATVDHLHGQMAWLQSFLKSLNFFKIPRLQQFGFL